MESNVKCEEFDNFIKNPYPFTIDEEDLNHISNGKYYNLSNNLDFIFDIDDGNGSVRIEAYFDGIALHIFSMGSDPVRSGYGQEVLKYMHEKLHAMDLWLNVDDVIDESTEFWDKMYNRGYID